MTTTPQVTLETLCIESTPTFSAEGTTIQFGVTDFTGQKAKDGTEKYTYRSGVFVQQDQTINAIDLQQLPIYHELHLKPYSTQRIQSMQIQQNPNNPTQFNLLIGAMSGCCDGAVIGGLYSVEDNSFDILFSKRVPFNPYAIVGAITYPTEQKDKERIVQNNDTSAHLFVGGCGCDGAGIQYIYACNRFTEQEYILNLKDVQYTQLDPRITESTLSSDSFLHDYLFNPLKIKNNALTYGQVNIEQAYKIAQHYDKKKELWQTETDEQKKRTIEYNLNPIEETLSKIRHAASQSKFLRRERDEVYP